MDQGAAVQSALKAMRTLKGQTNSVSEIEFRTPYVVAERWIVARLLRFMHAKNVHSDTLLVCHPFVYRLGTARQLTTQIDSDQTVIALVGKR